MGQNDTHEPAGFEEVFNALGLSIDKVSRDLLKAGANVNIDGLRFIVDMYYKRQEDRIRYAAQVRQLEENIEEGEVPNEFLRLSAGQAATLEAQAASALDYYSRSNPITRWMRSITGIGPVIACGLLSHLKLYDTRGRIEYVGQWWRFAGMDPSMKWEKKTKRPFNADLKKLLFLLGESFVKVKSNKNDVYGRLYEQRKEILWQNNLSGDYKDAALNELKNKKYSKDTNAFKWYSGLINPEWARSRWESESKPKFPVTLPKKSMEGTGLPMLPPAHIHARARRWVCKLFLSHLFEVMYVHEHGELPNEPFVLSMDGHNRKIEAPAYRDYLV